MITFHEIRRIIEKMAVLSSHITQLNQLIPEMVRLSEKIDSLNEDLTLERDQMTAKIRSVEVLGEILRTHVYQNQAAAAPDPSRAEFGTVSGSTKEDGSSQLSGMTDSEVPGNMAGGEHQTGFYQKLNGRSLML